MGSEFWRMTAPRALGVAVGVGTAGSGSWEAGKAARFRVGWSCRDWDRGTGAAYGKGEIPQKCSLFSFLPRTLFSSEDRVTGFGKTLTT